MKIPLLVSVSLTASLALSAGGCAVSSEGERDEARGTSESALRRSDFGQNRALSLRKLDGTWQSLSVPASGNATFSTASGAISEFRATSWLGDANSYLEVYDNPLTTTIAPFGITLPWSSSGTFRRIRFPLTSDSSFYTRFGSFPRAFLTELPDGHFRAIRMVDRGECSGEASYRSLLTAIDAKLTSKLDTELAAAGLGGASLRGRPSLTPILGATRDSVSITASYDVHRCDAGLDVSFAGHFEAEAGVPAFVVESVSAPIDFRDDFCAGFVALAAGFGFDAGALQNKIRGQIETALRTELGPAIQSGMIRTLGQMPAALSCNPAHGGDSFCRAAFQIGLISRGDTNAANALGAINGRCLPTVADATRNECVFVPTVQRINTRPDGIEVVLAEDRSDPFYAMLNTAGVCARPEGTIEDTGGAYGAISDPMLPGDPAIFGN